MQILCTLVLTSYCQNNKLGIMQMYLLKRLNQFEMQILIWLQIMYLEAQRFRQ